MITINITLEQIREQLIRNFISLDGVVVHSAAITSLTPETNKVVIEGLVIYEYYDDNIEDVNYMIYRFYASSNETEVEFIEPIDESVGGFEMLEEAEALIPFDSINIE